MVTGESSLNNYAKYKEANAAVLDIVLQNLPATTDALNLRKISGSKHIISAVVDCDNLNGKCKGTGRIQIRLNHGETAELKSQVKDQKLCRDPSSKV